ncbi:MAG: hypothetical protein IJL37_09990 [Bacteroidaceae bacterium]|nr:hypothetical protein [Bacteroidaceae bacterium]MBQ9499597.1 hypothetical protein [Bacteroidaceae bacterium]
MYEIDDLFRDSVIFEDFLDDGKKKSDSHSQSSDSDSSSSSSGYDYDSSSSSEGDSSSSSSYSGSNYYLYKKKSEKIENKPETETAKEEVPAKEANHEEPKTEIKPKSKLKEFVDKHALLVALVIIILCLDLVFILLDFLISWLRN